MKEQNTMEIDVFHLFKILWKRKILIALVAIVAGALAFAYSAFIVKPCIDPHFIHVAVPIAGLEIS